MAAKVLNVLFLCTGNSARSIMAECLLNRLGAGAFVAYSAGSLPRGSVNLCAIELLRQFGYAIGDLRSKSWDEFERPGTPVMDFVFTLCDTAAGEVCPVWPGQPMIAHWGFPDPAAAAGPRDRVLAAFHDVYRQIEKRLSIFV
ncbi:MAG: arsenate reductase ArsC, partial [Alphaproteobacteria bacterium]